MATPEELVADELAALLHKVDDSSTSPLDAGDGEGSGDVTSAPPDPVLGEDAVADKYRHEESKAQLRLQQQIDADEDVRTFSQDIEGVLHQGEVSL